MVILPSMRHYSGFVNNDLPNGTLLAVSKSGYNDDVLALQWLKYVELHTWSIRRKRLLLLDGHGSHCTYEFIEFCDQHDIIPFYLPPHSTHLLQPLDLMVFQPYKHSHAAAVNDATRSGCTNFNKIEFLAALTSIRKNTFKPSTIHAAWRAAGIVPYDPSVVLAKIPSEAPMEAPAPARPKTPRAQADKQPAATPKSLRGLTRLADTLGYHMASPIVDRLGCTSTVTWPVWVAQVLSSNLRTLTYSWHVRPMLKAHVPAFSLAVTRGRRAS